MNKKILHGAFEKQAVLSASSIAAQDKFETISYLQLNGRANRIGHLLMELSPMQGFVVATMLPSGIGLVSSVLGIWKTGGIYLPMDPGFSESRIRQIFDHTSPIVLITNRQWEGQVNKMIHGLGVMPGWVMVLGDAGEIEVTRGNGTERRIVKLEELNDENPGVEVDAESGNYIFYTSGSTGIGKPILGCHKGLSHFIHWQIEEFGLGDDCRVSQLTQITFDASLRDIFVPLITGGTLYIPEASTKSNVEKLLEWIEEKGITLVHCVPSLFRLILKESAHSEKNYGRMRSVRQILMAGEMLYAKDILDWQKNIGNHIELVNLYGPTETTLVKTFHRIKEVPENGSQVMHVGKPISNTAIAIINEGMACNEGEIGEIYIKTAFWTKGYYKDPVLTDQVFVQNPLVNDRKDIVYRTGDMGRYLGDRSIEVLGRVDDQVKVNGVRVELGEIEGAVLKMPGVEETVALVHRNANNENELVCYYVGRLVDEDQLRMYLKQELNENIIPGYFVQMESFPLTLNGKVDKKSLPKPEKLLMEGMEYEAVNNETERKLEKIWKEVLGRDRIGRKATFFKIGGTSLKAIQVISRIYREFDVSLLIIADIFSHQTIAALSELIQKAQKEKYEEIPVIEEQLHYALSHAQKRLWVIDQLENESKTAYNIPMCFRMRGSLNMDALENAFHSLIKRHESLRTTFIIVDGEPRQKVHDGSGYDFRISYHDLRNDAEKEMVAAGLASEESSKNFQLDRGPLFRCMIMQMGDDEIIFLLTLHHIISDGWSMEVLVGEILELYQGYEKGEPVVLKPLRIQYKDYAAWQNQLLEEEGIASHRTYWKEKLSGDLPILALPTDYRRPEIKNNNGAIIELHLDKKLQDQFDEQSHQHGVTLFMMLLSTVNVLLHRYTGQEDIIIGTAVAGREHVDLEDQIGFYVNTLALRTQVKGEESFRGLLSHVKEVALGAFEHQVYPFDRLVEELELERDLSRMPVFDVMMSLQNTDGVMAPREFKGIDQVSVSGYAMQSTVSKFDLTFNFQEYENGILLQVNYSTELFSAKRMERMMGHYKRIVEEVLSSGDAQVGKIDYLTKEERKQILKDFNNTYTNYPRNKTVVDIFEEQVRRTPGNTAVVFEDISLTYEELNGRSNQLAAWLREHYDIKPGDLIAIMMERSEWLIISILAVLKSGAGYVPLDPSYPVERRRYMVEDSGVKCVLLESSDLLAEMDSGKEYLDISDQWEEEISKRSRTNLPAVNKPSDIIYVIYTSGSTGRPKGCVVEHRNVVNLVKHTNYADLKTHHRILQLSNYAFDGSVFDIFASLLNGAGLYMVTKDTLLSNEDLTRYIEQHAVNIMFITTTMFNNFVEMSAGHVKYFDKIYFGGEQISVAHVREALKYKKSSDSIVHVYGPTEATTFSSYHVVLEEKLKETDLTIPIGTPLTNARIYILNQQRTTQPIGVPGELCISGAGLARGYLNHDALTKEKFIDNPFEPGEKLYRTGDIARWMEDGNIEFLGRKDHQVKLRGHRIELGEIESVLKNHGSIDDALVMFCGEGANMYIAGYYKSGMNLRQSVLRQYLDEQLPAYMIPSHLIQVEEFLLNANGKIDRSKLPDPFELGIGQARVYEAATNGTEAALISIWEEVLGCERIGITDNFFELGGHSIKAIKVAGAVSKKFDKYISLKDIFTNPTIAELSRTIADKEQSSFYHIPVAEEQPDYVLSHAQKRLWVMDQLGESKTIFNISGGYLFNGHLDIDSLRHSFEKVIDRHESLRTIFITRAGEPRQKICTRAELGYKLDYTDLSGEKNIEAKARELSEQESNTIFDLSRGPLIRTQLIRLSENRYIFLLTLHHIISDGWSIEVMIREVMELYKNFINDETSALKPLRVQYKDYATWQNKLLQNNRIESHRAFWKKQFSGELHKLDLPSDYGRTNHKSYNGKIIQTELNDLVVSRLTKFCTLHDTTIFTSLFTAVNILLYRYTGQLDLITGVPTTGRSHKDTGDQIGFFVNILPIRTLVVPGHSFDEIFLTVKHSLTESYKYESFAYVVLEDELTFRDACNSGELFNVLVQLDRAPVYDEEETASFKIIQVDDYNISRESSKYDITFFFVVEDENNKITLSIEYNTDLFKETTIEKIRRDLLHMLLILSNDTSISVSDKRLIEYESEEQEAELFTKPVNEIL